MQEPEATVEVRLSEWRMISPSSDGGECLRGLRLSSDGREIAKTLTKARILGIREIVDGVEVEATSYVGRVRLGQLTITVERGTYRPRLAMLGTVSAEQDITLSPRISGQVIEISPEFVPGGIVHKGDLLLRLDPADFDNALAIRLSELQQAAASLKRPCSSYRPLRASSAPSCLGSSAMHSSIARVARRGMPAARKSSPS